MGLAKEAPKLQGIFGSSNLFEMKRHFSPSWGGRQATGLGPISLPLNIWDEI